MPAAPAPIPALFDDHAVAPLSPELLRAARWIEQHPREVALHSMRDCARRAELAPASFTRLAQAIGFEGFQAIRAHCQEALSPQAAYTARAQALQATARRNADWFDALNEAQHANTASISGLNGRAQFERAADAMLAARQVQFLGLRASHGLAFHLHYTYGLVAPNGVLVQGLGGTLADQLAQLQRQDLLVAISQSPYTRQTVQAVEQARENGAKVLALTDSRLSPIAGPADRVLLFRAGSPSYFHSMVGALALAEALGAAVAVRGGRKVLGRLAAMQQRLDAQGAYWASREPPSLPSAGSPRKS
jgi:DNA-binding MurR/RpiR family transcriptional regulator